MSLRLQSKKGGYAHGRVHIVARQFSLQDNGDEKALERRLSLVQGEWKVHYCVLMQECQRQSCNTPQVRRIQRQYDGKAG